MVWTVSGSRATWICCCCRCLFGPGLAHGYAIISVLRDRSGGTFDLREGTIYPALHRLEGSGLLGQHLGPGRGAAPPGLRADR